MDFTVGILKQVLIRRNDIEGELGYFGLGQWWLSTFSASEREYVERLYRPSGSRGLTKGKGPSAYPTAANLLTAVAGELRKRLEDRNLAIRVLARAEDRALAEDDVLGLHFTYQEMIRLHYTWREHVFDAQDTAFAVCYKQARIAPLAAQVFRERCPGRPLPSHVGYELMATILAKQGDLAQAIEVCKQAQSQGWPGNWTWRIQRLARQMGTTVVNMSSAGITQIRP